MVNPLQRRKARSSTSKVTYSKRHYKNKKKVVVKGPEVLVKNWDRSLTARQNYDKLGLMPVLNPRQSGGLEKKKVPSLGHGLEIDACLDQIEEAIEASEDESKEPEEEAGGEDKAPQPLQAGMGRIIKDENGKVIKVVLPGDDGEEIEEDVREIEREDDEGEDDDEDEEEEEEEPQEDPTHTLWGKPFEDVTDFTSKIVDDTADDGVSRQGIPIVSDRIVRVKAKTEVVESLERLSTRQRHVVRHSSELELDWLVKLVAKHGDNVGAMVKDPKLNVWQKTRGEIKKSIEKAGGLALLKKEAKASL